MSNRQKNALLFLLIFCLTVFLRFWQLDQIPPGLYPDEAVNATDSLQALREGSLLTWYYPNNNGREGLFLNLIGVSLKTFGINLFNLRMVPAFLSILSLIGFYFLGKELFGTRFGILVFFLLSTSYWYLNFSRIGFRAIMVPMVLCWSFFFLFKGIKKHIIWKKFQKKYSNTLSENKKNAFQRKSTETFKNLNWGNFLIAGLIFGVGFHTYIAFRIAPVIVFIFFGLFFLACFCNQNSRNLYKKIFLLISIFWLGVFITASPIIYHFITHHKHLNARQNDNSISILDPKNHPSGLIKTLTITFSKTLGQFFLQGDNNWRHNLPNNPLLSPLERIFFIPSLTVFFGLFFLSGFKLTRKRIQNTKFFKINRYVQMSSFFDNTLYIITLPEKTFILSGTLLAWFFIMLSPAFLTVEGIPHALRSIGALPAILLIIGTTFFFIFKQKTNTHSRKKNQTSSNLIDSTSIMVKGVRILNQLLNFNKIILGVALILSSFINFYSYFFIWGKSIETSHAFEKELVNIGVYLGLKQDLIIKKNFSQKQKAEVTNNNQSNNPFLKRYYLIVNDHSKIIDTGFPVSLETIRFFTFSLKENYLYLDEIENLTYVKEENIDKEIKDREKSLQSLYGINYQKNFEIILQRPDHQMADQLANNLLLEKKVINITPEIPETEFLILN